jgi:hypothetical protein
MLHGRGVLFFRQLQWMGYGKPLASDCEEVLMSYKLLQLSPLSTDGPRVKISIRSPWSAPPANFNDVSFLRSWLIYDSGLDELGVPGSVNWNGLLGLALAAVVSAGFWAGVGLAVAEVWK